MSALKELVSWASQQNKAQYKRDNQINNFNRNILKIDECKLELAESERYRNTRNSEKMLRESLADYAHEAWSGWMKYLYTKCSAIADDGAILIPASLVERWERQMNTSYSDLPENEKESDRKEADKMIEIFDAN